MSKLSKSEMPVEQPRLVRMHAVYVRDEGVDWQLFSAEPNLECAKTTASVLEVTRPNSDCCIVPPNASGEPRGE
jgi:hypothetical protein